MATTDRTSTDARADALVGRLEVASFAHLLVRADGASIAAAGLLAGACVATDTPYQVSVVRTRRDLHARAEAADESATTVRIGVPEDDVDADGRPTPDGPVRRPSVTAYEAAAGLCAEVDPALALAGVVAGGERPEDVAPAIVARTGFERRPGLSAPTADQVDAIAHSTLVHVPYSGDVDAAGAVVADLDEAGTDATDRRVASLLAIDAVSAEGTTERAAEAVARVIHPLAGGPVETVEGYADVLDALAAVAPGLATALALGGDPEPALDAWREHAAAAHDGVRTADVTPHDGLVVARTDGPVEAVARLVRDFRSPEPAVLAVGDGEAAIATVEPSADRTVPRSVEAFNEAAGAIGGSALVHGGRGYARFDPERAVDFVDAVTEAI